MNYRSNIKRPGDQPANRKLLVEKKRLIFYELTTTYLLNLKCFDAQVRSLPSTGLRNVAQYIYYKFDVDPKSLEHPSPFY